MVGFKVASVVATASLFASAALAQTVDPIVIKGSKFFYKTNGTEFFIRGVAYQQDVGSGGTSSANVDYVDPLTDSAGCTRDLPYLTALRTNTIRVYAIDPTKDRTACMNMLAAAGIYVIADLSAPDAAINRDSPEWDIDLYNRYASVIDVMAPFTNTLGFFAGNEVSNNQSNVDAIPFVKAAARDMKAYIKEKGYRSIGVGYAADDDATIRAPLADYINCGPAEDSIDFFGYNIYSWCGIEATYQSSGDADRTAEYANYSIPAFFAEYGCNQPEPRYWNETTALFSSPMSDVWSGGIVFEYFQAANNYGLVTLSGNTITTLGDYGRLSSVIATVNPTGVNMASYTPTNTAARACPADDSSWAANTNLPPTPNQAACECMVQSLGCAAKQDISEDAIGANFNYLCDPAHGGDTTCEGIQRDGKTGVYGAWSMCNSTDQLSFVMNAYYLNQVASNSANTDPCDFSGNATTQSPTATGNCGALVSQAGTAGTGVVTSEPTGNAVGSSSSSTSSSAAGAAVIPAFDTGLLKLSIYVVCAAMVGAGIVIM